MGDCTASGTIESGTHFNMQWTLPPSGTGVIRWTPHPDKCFQVAGGSTANGANLELCDCDDTDPNQQFTIPASGSGVIKWATNPTKCVDVKDGKTVTGSTFRWLIAMKLIQTCYGLSPR